MTTWFVSRHAGAVAWAAAQGIHVDRLVAHLDLQDIQPQDRILGTLPVYLAAQVCAKGAEYWHLSLEIPAHLRGAELSAEQMNVLGACLQRFAVLAL
jgi:CRISPR-associated protein Csx16